MRRGKGAVISLFSGALGLDLGLERAGFRVAVAVESNKVAAQTIRRNRSDIEVIERDIAEVTTGEILEAAGLAAGEPMIVSAGPSCQTFSTAGRRQSVAEPRGTLFRHFLRVVQEAKPRFFVMENVRGVLSAAIKHRPLAERGPGHPQLRPEERYGSGFALILDELRDTGYSVFFDLLNAADLGAPQRRERLVFIGSRDGQRVCLPRPTHAADAGRGQRKWATLRDAVADLDDPDPVFTPLPPSKSRVMQLVPEGGNWRHVPADMHPEILGRAYESWGGRTGFFRRLTWDQPTPALTTRPDSKATMLCHPSELRPLSTREYARVQQFPDDWEFAGSPAQQYQQIGNAVPLAIGESVGQEVLRASRRKAGLAEPGEVYCQNEELLARLRKGRGTVLNPRRMRGESGLSETREWMQGTHAERVAAVDLILPWPGPRIT